MGNLNPFKTPKMPQQSPEDQKALADLRKQQQQEAQDLENAKKERIRKIAGNLIGPKSTQSKQLEGFTGFRDDDDEDELGMKNRSKNKTMGRIKIGY
tara:strand:+ start:309 stop:599 length:291 start_codon:yes stop_codon:yes gene_type:complete